MRSDDLRALREERRGIHEKMLALNATAAGEGRDLTEEENAEYRKMRDDFETRGNAIQRAGELAASGRDLERERITSFLPDGKTAASSLKEYRKARFGDMDVDPEYRTAFYHWLTARSLSDLETEEYRVLSKASGAAGGFFVPTDMTDAFLRALRFQGSMGSLANVINTASGDTLNYPVNSAHGTATWTAENATYTASDETLANVQFSAYKAGTTLIVSEELLEDTKFPLDQFLATEFGERISVLEETSYIVGDGIGKPQGILGSVAGSSNITTVTAAVGNTTSFNYTALVTAIFSLPAQYRPGSSWVVNDTAARNLYLLLDSQNRPLWSVNVATNGPDTFLGYSIYTHPDMPAPAINVISAMFGNWKRVYSIRQVDGFHMQRLNELYANTGQVGYRGWQRVDGKVMLAAAGIALKHSAT